MCICELDSGEPDRNFQLDKRRPCGIKEKCQKYLSMGRRTVERLKVSEC